MGIMSAYDQAVALGLGPKPTYWAEQDGKGWIIGVTNNRDPVRESQLLDEAGRSLHARGFAAYLDMNRRRVHATPKHAARAQPQA